MSSHAMIISATQWQQVFVTIIFPLFERAGARSRIAMISKEAAIAPELKKGKYSDDNDDTMLNLIL